MALAQADWLDAVLRMAIYAGTVLTAGGALFRLTFPRLAQVQPPLRRQVLLGTGLLIICEPLRYLLFLQQIAGGDFALALSPSMRWIGMETPLGQAAVIRLAAALVLVIAGLRWRMVGLAAALAMVGSYLGEGHTASSDARWVLAPLLFAHLVAVHWWIGGLPGLFAATRSLQAGALAELVAWFGRIALWAVVALVSAVVILLGVLTGWHLDLSSGYQQAFVLKLGAVAVILAIAAFNRLRLTPVLASDAGGRGALRASLRFEAGVAGVILLATAFAISFSPSAT